MVTRKEEVSEISRSDENGPAQGETGVQGAVLSPFPESEYADFSKRIHEADRVNSLIVEKTGKGSRSFQDSIVKANAEALRPEPLVFHGDAW